MWSIRERWTTGIDVERVCQEHRAISKHDDNDAAVAVATAVVDDNVDDLKQS